MARVLGSDHCREVSIKQARPLAVRHPIALSSEPDRQIAIVPDYLPLVRTPVWQGNLESDAGHETAIVQNPESCLEFAMLPKKTISR